MSALCMGTRKRYKNKLFGVFSRGETNSAPHCFEKYSIGEEVFAEAN